MSSSVGEYIKSLRLSKDMTQEELGNVIGVKKAAVQKWESGMVQNLKRNTIKQLADFFDVSPSSFIDGSGLGDICPIKYNINSLCIQNGLSENEVLKALEIPNLNNKGEYSDESIRKLCEYFYVTPEFLLNSPNTAICPCCNHPLNFSSKNSDKSHTSIHNKFLTAVEKFGFCWGPAYRNEVKSIASEIIDNESSTTEQLYIASVLKMKVYFSRSLAGCVFSLKHISFDDYCAALLGQKNYSERIPSQIFKLLVNKYGTNNLIPYGTYYDIQTSEVSIQKVEPQEKSNIAYVIKGDIYNVPVYETVSAGFGAYACNEIIDYVPTVISNPYEAEDTIAIKVKGDSMYPKIEDGDIIVVRKQESVDSGEIAVVLLDGDEGLVKKVKYGSDWIDLVSINPEYKVKHFEGEEVERVRIVGLVRQIIKTV